MVKKRAAKKPSIPPGYPRYVDISEPMDRSADEVLRKALFATIETTSGKMRAIDAFYRSLADASARGDVSATLSLSRITELVSKICY